jgi:hypothetical protein
MRVFIIGQPSASSIEMMRAPAIPNSANANIGQPSKVRATAKPPPIDNVTNKTTNNVKVAIGAEPFSAQLCQSPMLRLPTAFMPARASQPLIL